MRSGPKAFYGSWHKGTHHYMSTEKNGAGFEPTITLIDFPYDTKDSRLSVLFGFHAAVCDL